MKDTQFKLLEYLTDSGQNPFREWLEGLRDRQARTTWLRFQEIFLLALRDIVEARGFSKVSQDTRLNRENLYRMLSTTGNPQLSSLNTLLNSIGLRLAVEVQSVDYPTARPTQ